MLIASFSQFPQKGTPLPFHLSCCCFKNIFTEFYLPIVIIPGSIQHINIEEIEKKINSESSKQKKQSKWNFTRGLDLI